MLTTARHCIVCVTVFVLSVFFFFVLSQSGFTLLGGIRVSIPPCVLNNFNPLIVYSRLQNFSQFSLFQRPAQKDEFDLF